MIRPDPIRWLWYALGGGLPARHREWVLHDVTVRTWVLRQLLRALVQVLPVAALVILIVPGQAWVRLAAVAGGAMVGMVYAAAYVYETTEHRAMKAGFPPGTAQAVRDASGSRAAARERYVKRYRDLTPRDSG